ncbi:MAG: hypothetical protein WCI75_18080, partial [candidate division NC10 bacterium]
MKLTAAILLLACILNPNLSWARPSSAAAPVVHDALILPSNAALLSLVPGPKGAVIHQRKNASGEVILETVDAKALERIKTFLAKLPKKDPEQGMALALRSYLEPRMDPRDIDNNAFLKKDDKGRLHLSDLGRESLYDVITASDGELIEPLVEPKEGAQVVEAGARPLSGGLSSAGEPGSLASLSAANLASLSNGAAFDGNSARHSIGSFDWNNLDSAAVKAGGLTSVAGAALDGYAVDRKNNTVRVIVAAKNSVASDRLKETASAEDAQNVLKETGLDAALFAQNGAKVVRAVDNLVTVDVPLDRAAKLGLALEGQGVESRPARVFRAASAALTGPVASMLGMQFMPVPALNPLVKDLAPQMAQPKDVSAQMVQSRSMLNVEGLWKSGM